jgi:hypothetical protein
LGWLKVSQPSALFMDPFDGGTVDVTDRWTSSVSGAGAAITQATGVLTIATTTTVSARANLVSKGTFINSGGTAVCFLINVKLETGAALTNADRWWGWATLPGTPTYAAPVTDGVGFKLHDATLTATVYSAGSATTVATLTAKTDNAYHRYMVCRRTDLYAWYLDDLDVPVASSQYVIPAVQTLPLTLAMANNTSGPSSGPTFLVTSASVFENVSTNIQIADGVFPWRQQTVKDASIAPVAADKAAVVTQSPNGGNPCQNPSATLTSFNAATSGTASVQIVAISGSTKIYVCSMIVVGTSGTSPTFALRYGTGSACGTGTVTIVGAFTTTANTLFNFATPFAVTPAGQALCYIQTGTTPISQLSVTYVQQ